MKKDNVTKTEQEILLSKAQYAKGDFTSNKTVDELFGNLGLD